MKKGILVFLIGMVLANCGSSSKTISSDGNSADLEQLISSKSFEIQMDWATPMASASLNSIANAGLLNQGNNASRISLIGNANFLKVKGDTVSAFLPYYGERQMGGGYNNDGSGIKFEGVPRNYKVSKNDKHNRHEIHFDINEKSESFNVVVTLFPNMSSSVNISSSQRSPIGYQGKVKALSEE